MNIKMNKEKLIQIVKANQAKHQEQFTKAHESYKKQVLEWFEKQQEALKNDKHFTTYLNLPEPKNQSRDYNRVLSMLENSVDTEIMLNENDYRQYIQDIWSWTNAFKTTASAYGVVDPDYDEEDLT